MSSNIENSKLEEYVKNNPDEMYSKLVTAWTTYKLATER